MKQSIILCSGHFCIGQASFLLKPSKNQIIHQTRTNFRVKSTKARMITSPRSSLWSLPEDLASAFHTGTTIAILTGISLSLLPILTGDSKERNQRRFLQPNAEESAENIKWGVMTTLSLFPFLNPLSWVFGALDDEDSALLYWTFAAIYTFPYLSNGFELDGYAVGALLLGAVHMQIERIAQTEPVEIELPDVIRALLRSLPHAVTALGRYGAGVGSEVMDRMKKSDEAQKRKPDRKFLEERSREARAELEEFDRKRRVREKERKNNK